MTAVLPPPVRAGDLVGVAALSSPAEAAALGRGIAQLESFGLRVRRASNIDQQWRLFAGEDRARLDGFHELVADEDVRAVFFSRGGHGLLRVLPGIDWSLLASQPKAYVGYSDLTPLLLQIVERLGLICFHGPMVATELARPLAESERRSLLDSLAGRPEQELACRGRGVEAEVVGELVGGCLSLLTACLGTAYFPALEGRLLFLEDVNEPLYRVDRMLTQLRLSGTLKSLKGLIFGEFHPADDGHHDCDVPDLMSAAFDQRTAPLAWGIASGHCTPNLTLPMGATARLVRRKGIVQLTVGVDGDRGDG